MGQVIGKHRNLVAVVGVIAVVFSVGVQAAAASNSIEWVKYVVSDGSMSFHHPQGWQVSEVGGTILANGPDGEQLCLCALPYYQGWGPEQHARFMVAALQAQNPGLQVTGWKTDPAGDAVFLDLAYSGAGVYYGGTGLAIADAPAEQAVWFHYLCAESKYSESRAEQVFKGFVTSLAEGASSQPPGRLARNADAFAFVVGFALGSPLSMAEEEVVLAELERYWSGRSESELAVYDEYHEIVSIVMKIGDRQQLADVQRLLGNTVRQWLLGSDPNDPVVQVICRYMLEPDRVLAPGPPAMTEVAATAYGELIAYARLLAEDPAAVPGDIDPDEVAEIVALLVRDWALFTDAVREQVLTAPAVWTALRRSIIRGDDAQRQAARSIVAGLAPYVTRQSRGAASGGARSTVMDLALYNAMVQVQETTFNHWTWCHGLRGAPTSF